MLLYIIAKTSTKDAIKTGSKRAIQKTAEATVDLIGNKIAGKITSVSAELHPMDLLSKKSSAELRSKNDDANSETEVPKKKYLYQEERQQIIDELRLV